MAKGAQMLALLLKNGGAELDFFDERNALFIIAQENHQVKNAF